MSLPLFRLLCCDSGKFVLRILSCRLGSFITKDSLNWAREVKPTVSVNIMATSLRSPRDKVYIESNQLRILNWSWLTSVGGVSYCATQWNLEISLNQTSLKRFRKRPAIQMTGDDEVADHNSSRRLAAIMFVDIVGYTALGQRNESLSLILVEQQRKLIRPLLKRHNGREIKTIGDGLLVELSSALDAVRCAYDIQRAAREFNFSVEAEQRIHLRVGIHVGDVVESSDGDISGDAVNVASRIEALAKDGGVCLTRQVYDHVQNKFELRLDSLGDKTLKNVSAQMEVFKMIMPWEDNEKLGSTTRLDSRRLAVMPFVNMSTDPGDAYFADGLTEELISTISNIRELTVISRTSVMKYKGGTATVSEIGRALKVGSIIEGSVRKSLNRARVTAQLIDVDTDGHLWSRSYDREMNDIFAIQSEIAQQVADALKIQLVASEKQKVEKKATTNPEAHTMYLKGRYFWNERTKEGLDKAVKYLEEAIKMDPKFALAYSGLADCYTIYADWFWMDPSEAFPKAREYDLRALDIEPDLAEAHASLGIIYNSYDGKWQESENEFKLALELKPGLAYAHMWYGLLLNVIGRHDKTISELREAARIDPLSRLVKINIGAVFTLMGKSKEAIQQFEILLEEEPYLAGAHESLGWAYLLDQRPDDAVKEIRRSVDLSRGDSWMKTSLACILALTGKREEALKLLKELEDTAKTAYVSKVQLAQVLFALEKNDEAFAYLEKAYSNKSIFTNHASDLASLRYYPWFRGARSDNRWADFVRRLGLQTS
jgi:adenylate cyclase